MDASRQSAAGVHTVDGQNLIGLNGNAFTTNGNANNHQHWTQVYCGHEIQINETLTGNNPGTGGGDPHSHVFTGDAINFAVAYVDVVLATKD